MIKMLLSLEEMCYLRITESVNSEKLPGQCEKRDHQHRCREASANFHIIPAINSVTGTTFLLVRDTRVSLMTGSW